MPKGIPSCFQGTCVFPLGVRIIRLTASYIGSLGVGQTGFGKVGLNIEELWKTGFDAEDKKISQVHEPEDNWFCNVAAGPQQQISVPQQQIAGVQ